MFSSDEKMKELFGLIDQSGLVFQSTVSKEIVHKWDAAQVVIGDVHSLDMEMFSDTFDIPDATAAHFCVAYPNLDCKVTFDHPLDHLPLMSLMEIGRQFGIAISHNYYDVPLSGYINIADSLSFGFTNFVELDRPTYIVCVDSEVKDKNGKHRRKMNFSFLQEGVECASASGNMSVFKKAMYQRMRTSSRSKIIQERVKDASEIPTNVDVYASMLRKAV